MKKLSWTSLLILVLSACSFPLTNSSKSSSIEIASSSFENQNYFKTNHVSLEERRDTNIVSKDLSNHVAIPKDYYSSISTWKNGDDLKEKLSAILNQDNVKTVSYVGNWEVNQLADEDIDNHDMVNQLYSPTPILKVDNRGAQLEGWQREHAFCASLMTGMNTGEAVEKTKIAQDFHNLFASWGKANGMRSNKSLAILEDGSSIGENKYNDSFFYPYSNEDCGKEARAIFYMATRYCHDENYPLTLQEEASKSGSFSIGKISDLLKWNKLTPTRSEVRHNIAVFSYQNNRNPYIDYPELADYVFGDKKLEAGKLSDLACTINENSYLSSDFSSYCLIKDVMIIP